jgi:branched-chain amino acid transport system substrate-binding protein
MSLITKKLAQALALGCAAMATAQAEDIIKIGHVAATSGGIAHLGKDNENGARMAVDELNAKGVVIGGKKYRIVLQAEDDAADPKQGTTVAQKLVDAKVQGVIGHETSGTTIPLRASIMMPAFRRFPLRPAPSSTRASATTPPSATSPTTSSSVLRWPAAMQTMKAQRIAVIDDRTAYGKGLADEFIKNVKRQGAATGSSIVNTQYTTDKATDFNAILTAVKPASRT